MTIFIAQRETRLAPSVGLAIAAMIAIQAAAALSRPLVAEIGAPGVTWIRMATAAAILLVITRPRLRGLDRRSLWAALMLGAALATMSAAYFAAVSRIPLGLAATITFLGPFSVAVFGARGWRPLAFSLLAGLGVLLSLEPWSQGTNPGWTVDPVGLLLAGIAALGFAAYILLTRRVGQLFSGTDGLTISLLTAAILLTPFGIGGAHEMPSSGVILGAAGLAIFSPLLTCWMEMAAVRKLGAQVFSILLSLEPAIAAMLGIILLLEVPSVVQTAGIFCVVLASIAVVRSSAKSH
jgi:inner membrane transporter RhtA